MINHYPQWARELAKKYLSRSLNQFIIHGNIHDLVPVTREKETSYQKLKHFLSEEFIGSRDIVVFYDSASGIYFRDAESRKDFSRALSGLDSYAGTEHASRLAKDPVGVFSVLEQYFRSRIGQKKSIALMLAFANTVIPCMAPRRRGTADRNSL